MCEKRGGTLRDAEGRTVGYLRLSVTDRCTCRCVYCMPEGGVPLMGHGDVCSFEELTAIVEALVARGVRKVRLTGGEPLVRRGIVDLVRMLRAVPGVEELALTTNAVLLAPLAEELAQAGLDRVNISLNSLDADRYRAITRGGRLEDALDGIRAAHAAGLTPLKLNCVLLGGVNDDEIPRMAAIAHDHAVDVRFIELMPIGEAASLPRECFIPASRVLEAVPELGPVSADGGEAGQAAGTCGSTSVEGVAELYTAPGWKGRVGLIRPMSHRFCAGCTRLRLTADGRLKPCLHSADEVPLRGLSGQALEQEIERALALKPAHHDMDGGRPSQSARPMNRIGG